MILLLLCPFCFCETPSSRALRVEENISTESKNNSVNDSVCGITVPCFRDLKRVTRYCENGSYAAALQLACEEDGRLKNGYRI